MKQIEKAHKILFRNPEAKELVDLDERTSSCISKMYVTGLGNAIHLAGQSCVLAGYLTRIVTV